MNKTLPIQIQVVDDHPVVRDGLTATINYQADMRVVAKSANGREAVEDFRKYKPDVTLMDLRMPEMDGVTAIAAIRSEFPKARIMVLTTYDGDEDIYRGLAAGAVGYLLKDTPMEELLKAIRNVHGEKTQVSPNSVLKKAAPSGGSKMSEKELEVLGLISRGYSNEAIGAALFMVEGAVKTHVASICGKLGSGQ
jgi:two-component system NarL family response regulator